ncbi:MAG TPA: hypothetical protein VFG69_15215 [Nannocystaceae bacterium]|nr:hypothetical protein [Nannocystaceae bacterium]
MDEAFSQLERAASDVHVRAPVLVVLPDPDARPEAAIAILGSSPVRRIVHAALRAGFEGVLFAPGARTEGAMGRDVVASDPVDAPALVVYDTLTIHPTLLQLMVAHPLEPDESFTLYDALGRPAAAFCGHLRAVPNGLPIHEELPYPEGLGPDDVARTVYPADRLAAESLVVASEQVFPSTPSSWRRRIGLPTLRWLVRGRRPLAQLELLAIAAAVAALPLALFGDGPGIFAAGIALLIGVHTSKLLKSVRALRRSIGEDTGDPAGERLARATRPLGHAAMTGGATYGILAATDRADIAGLVLLAAGFGATLLDLIQARFLLRGHEQPVFALPDAHAVAGRLGIRLPAAVEGAPLFECLVVISAATGWAELPWSILVGGAAARLWRWYAGPRGEGGD